MRSRPTRAILNLLSSAPLLALVGTGLVYLFLPRAGFGPSFDGLFRFAAPELWGVASLIAAITGYMGLFLCKKRLWLLAHGFAVALFLAMSILFGAPYIVFFLEWAPGQSPALPTGGPTGCTTYLALALNAWLRSADLYKDPFSKCP